MRNGAHGVVGNASGNGTTHPRRVSKQRIQTTVAALRQLEMTFKQEYKQTYIIKVNVCSAVVGEHKVTNRVRALNRVLVAIERVEEPRVLFGDKVTCLFVCPELFKLAQSAEDDGGKTYNVLVVRMQVDAALLSILPDFGDRLVLVGLVDNLGDDLGPLLDQTRVGRGQFGPVNSIGRGIFHQQRQESKDAANEEREEDEVGNQKDQEASPHCEKG